MGAWRGGAGADPRDGVLEAMVSVWAPDVPTLAAVIGPTISQRAYEVGPEFLDDSLAEDPTHCPVLCRRHRRPDAVRPAAFGLHRRGPTPPARIGPSAEWTLRHCPTLCRDPRSDSISLFAASTHCPRKPRLRHPTADFRDPCLPINTAGPTATPGAMVFPDFATNNYPPDQPAGLFPHPPIRHRALKQRRLRTAGQFPGTNAKIVGGPPPPPPPPPPLLGAHSTPKKLSTNARKAKVHAAPFRSGILKEAMAKQPPESQRTDHEDQDTPPDESGSPSARG